MTETNLQRIDEIEAGRGPSFEEARELCRLARIGLAVMEAEPSAWFYRNAHGVDALRNWDDFRPALSFTKPEAPAGSPDCIRDVTPLIPKPEADHG